MVKDRLTVLRAMMEQGVIPVFYHPDVEVCSKVIQACANGGAKCIEVRCQTVAAAARQLCIGDLADECEDTCRKAVMFDRRGRG